MQTKEVEYQLKFNKLGEERKFKLAKKKRLKIIDNCSWIEADTKNQWYFKDYKSFYIVVSMFKDKEFTVSCSGYSLKKKYKDIESAKLASLRFCDKLIK